MLTDLHDLIYELKYIIIHFNDCISPHLINYDELLKINRFFSIKVEEY